MKYLRRWLLLICLFAFPGGLMADHWQEIVSTTHPPASYGHSLVEIGGQAYLFGGYTTSTTSTTSTTRPRGPVNDLWKFDGQNWQMIADNAPPAPRYLHSAIVYRNKMFVFGGQSSTTCFSDLWSYDPNTKTWHEEPQGGLQKPEARAQHSAAVTEDGSMIVFGGRNSNGGIADDYAWLYNFSTGEWSYKNSNPTGCISGHSATIINSKMYVFGGKTVSGQSNTIVSYDPSQNAWSSVAAQGTLPNPRAFYAMTTEGTSFWVFGGDNSNVSFYDTWQFETTTNTWTRRRDMPSDVTRSKVVAIGQGRGTFHLMFGGMDANNNPVSRCYRYVSGDYLLSVPFIVR